MKSKKIKQFDKDYKEKASVQKCQQICNKDNIEYDSDYSSYGSLCVESETKN